MSSCPNSVIRLINIYLLLKATNIPVSFWRILNFCFKNLKDDLFWFAYSYFFYFFFNQFLLIQKKCLFVSYIIICHKILFYTILRKVLAHSLIVFLTKIVQLFKVPWLLFCLFVIFWKAFPLGHYIFFSITLKRNIIITNIVF